MCIQYGVGGLKGETLGQSIIFKAEPEIGIRVIDLEAVKLDGRSPKHQSLERGAWSVGRGGEEEEQMEPVQMGKGGTTEWRGVDAVDASRLGLATAYKVNPC